MPTSRSPGRRTKISELKGQEEIPDDTKRGGGSDDIGDISWTVPTVSLRFPANFQAGPGHNWANAIPMATPIAHKGVNHGAQVVAMTVMDILLRPDVVTAAKDYFTNVQTKQRKYVPLIRDTDKPATFLNTAIQEKYRPELKKHYYDPSRYKTYLEQLGIQYPTVRKADTKTTAGQ
jgi:aminobenzoyl-glutamate utilization protein B